VLWQQYEKDAAQALLLQLQQEVQSLLQALLLQHQQLFWPLQQILHHHSHHPQDHDLVDVNLLQNPEDLFHSPQQL
jgi:hypothetical protein